MRPMEYAGEDQTCMYLGYVDLLFRLQLPLAPRLKIGGNRTIEQRWKDCGEMHLERALPRICYTRHVSGIAEHN
jgi:hypothetical protein